MKASIFSATSFLLTIELKIPGRVVRFIRINAASHNLNFLRNSPHRWWFFILIIFLQTSVPSILLLLHKPQKSNLLFLPQQITSKDNKMARRNPIFALIWLVLLWFLAWPIAMLFSVVSFLECVALIFLLCSSVLT